MSKMQTGKQAPEKGSSDDWMSVLRMDQKFFERLEKKIRLQYSQKYPIPDPRQRLITILRYLATGQGYETRYAEMFDSELETIFKALYKHFEVSSQGQAGMS